MAQQTEKTAKLTPAQMKLAIKVDYNGTLRLANYTREQRTAAAMVKKGLLEITETDGIWGNYYGLTDAGYEAMGND